MEKNNCIEHTFHDFESPVLVDPSISYNNPAISHPQCIDRDYVSLINVFSNSILRFLDLFKKFVMHILGNQTIHKTNWAYSITVVKDDAAFKHSTFALYLHFLGNQAEKKGEKREHLRSRLTWRKNLYSVAPPWEEESESENDIFAAAEANYKRKRLRMWNFRQRKRESFRWVWENEKEGKREKVVTWEWGRAKWNVNSAYIFRTSKVCPSSWYGIVLKGQNHTKKLPVLEENLLKIIFGILVTIPLKFYTKQ